MWYFYIYKDRKIPKQLSHKFCNFISFRIKTHMTNIDDLDEEYGAIAENMGTKVQEKVRIWK